MSSSMTATSLFTTTHGGLAGGAAGGAEVVAFDAARNLLFVLGGTGVDALNATTGALVFSVPRSAVQQPGGGAAASLGGGNSVAVNGNNLAISFDGATPGSNGAVAVFTLDALGTSATWRATATVGAVPDMVTFTPDGARLLVAIEGEPTAGYAADPAGGVTVIDTATWTPSFFGFESFNAGAATLRTAGVRLSNAIPGSPQANTAQPSLDLEPEYITVTADGNTAYVTIQEANAIGVFNLNSMLGAVGWQAVLPLGLANHSQAGRGIDTSDRDGGPIIREVPIFGMYQPDAIASFTNGGRTYLVTANEGDAREYGGTGNVFNEMVRVSDLVPASGSTPPAGMPALDPALLSAVQSRRGDSDLGRLEVTRWSGDTDGDGDLDRLQVLGGRSFSIWEVGGTFAAPTITQVYDSRTLIDGIVASQFPALFDDGRSDNKGAEPESISLGTIGGALHAFVGLERFNGNMIFRIDGPTAVTYAGFATRPGDVAPEVTAFVPAAGSTPARLFVANEVSGTTTAYSIAPTTGANYTLQILHGSDFEAGLLAAGRADRFAAIVDRLEDAVPNSITLSGGDNFIPGPFAAAGTDPSVIPVLRAFYAKAAGTTPSALSNLFGSTAPFFAADVAILNAIGVQASALGNHEFDLGTNVLNAALDFTSNITGATPAARVTGTGAQFPYLSANLDFSADANIRGSFTTTLREASTYASSAADIAGNQAVANEAADAQIAPWTTIVEGGQTIGILGVTTQMLASISSPAPSRVADPANDGGRDNMAELAGILQPLIDQMTAQSINKIVLLSHLQQYQNELALAPLLRGVDVIVAAGSHAVFADSNDVLRPGDRAAEDYPVVLAGGDGNPVVIVSTSGEYSYVGRLNVTFDSNGVLIADPDGSGPLGIGGISRDTSGAIATTDANVAALWGADNPYAATTRGAEVRAITNAVSTVINAKDGTIAGFTKTFLDGRRGEIRTEETNLGNLTADANLWAARLVDAGVMVSHKNGGGIRAEIGAVLGQPLPRELPPLANPGAGKPDGGVSQLDIENSLRFNNAPSIVSVTAANLKSILEHSVAASSGTATPGQFGQWGGISFSWNPAGTAQVLSRTGQGVASVDTVTTPGSRIVNAAILNPDGSVAQELVRNGAVVGDPARPIKMVTLSFLADGGDNYPFPTYAITGSRVDLSGNAVLADGRFTSATKGTEQDVLAEYMATFHSAVGIAFGAPDTPATGDLRVINTALRSDAVFQTIASGTIGTEGSDVINGAAGNDTIIATTGRDVINAGAGLDTVVFQNIGRGDGGFAYDSRGSITSFSFVQNGMQGVTGFQSVERLTFLDGKVDFTAASTGHQVAMLYRGLLGREADARGQAFWTERLDGGASLRDVAEAFLQSTEGRAHTATMSDTAFVTNLYQVALGRAPESGAASFWSSQATGAAGRAGVVDGILRSPEAGTDPTSAAARGVVSADHEMTWIAFNYMALLGRKPDLAGLLSWDSAMESGMSEAVLTRSFVSSREFQDRFGALSNRDFVEQMYLNLLGRGSDMGGATLHTDALNGGTLSRGDLVHAMLSSREAIPALQNITAMGVELTL